MGALSFLFQNAFGGVVLSLLRSLHELKVMTFNCNSVLLSINAKLKKTLATCWDGGSINADMEPSATNSNLFIGFDFLLKMRSSRHYLWIWWNKQNSDSRADLYISCQRFHFPKTITRLTAPLLRPASPAASKPGTMVSSASRTTFRTGKLWNYAADDADFSLPFHTFPRSFRLDQTAERLELYRNARWV